MPARKNPPDLTQRNLDPLRDRLTALEARVLHLEQMAAKRVEKPSAKPDTVEIRIVDDPPLTNPFDS